MPDNKELNTLLDNLFSSVKNSYDISGMIKDIKEKEVADKDYEILSFGISEWHKIEHYEKQANGHFQNALSETLYTEYELIKEYPVFSIRRLSDNEVFCIGDEIIWNNVFDRTTLTEFRVAENNKLNVYGEGFGVKLNEIEKVKERVPLFTSEDGKEIFEPDETIWVVDKCDYELWSTNAISLACTGENKYFSTEDLAKTFVIMNKPCLSIREIMNNAKYVTNYRIEIDYKALRSIAEEKINNQ